MNIRIGNDVRVQIPISSFGSINPEDIKVMTCTFVKEFDNSTSNPFNIFHLSSSYTIHGCGASTYNVMPTNVGRSYVGPSGRGSVVYNDGVYVAPCIVSGTNIVTVFPAEVQNTAGTYDCHFDIKVLETGWDFDNLHSYRSSYSEVFTIVSNNTGLTGSITVTPDNMSKVDTYISSYTDTELSTLNGNYSSIINSIEGFELTGLVTGLKQLNIIGTNKRIVLISKYDSLSIMFNTFLFPMDMYEIDNGYYLYVSKYTYSNYNVLLNIVDSKIANTIVTPNPYIGNIPTTDSKNTYDNNSLNVYGTVTSNDLNVTGNINNYTMIL